MTSCIGLGCPNPNTNPNFSFILLSFLAEAVIVMDEQVEEDSELIMITVMRRINEKMGKPERNKNQKR